ncbi:MAG: hypothetical protein HGA36_05075 [Candidatus Moranbacteria bacterium]|nr:hypothetical protein [Candidatus Moranbacteria bacterium]
MKKSKYVWVFLCMLFLVGILLRTYNFSSWLRFNADQARDASVVLSMIEKGNIPLLGPVAGGTNFRIGPMSIYFQFVGAWLFGMSPDKMAYADLFFGILSVPLLFLLLREYFSKRVALISMALYATSFFAIQYSRFAWNSNSAQFFVMLLLFAIIKASHEKGGRKIAWAILAGTALGVAVQLHTLLLFAAPFFLVMIGVHLVWNKKINIVQVIVIVAMALVMNFPQILSEIKTSQGNVMAFYDGLEKKSPKQASLGGNVLHVAACQVQANVRILLPRVEQESCSFPFAGDNWKRIEKKNETVVKWTTYLLGFLFATAFSIFGCWLLVYRAFKLKDEKARIFFAVIFTYCAALLLVSFPFGSEISLRYFILTAFLPYLFVALFLEWIFKKNKTMLSFGALLAVGLIFLYNVYFCAQVFRGYANSGGNMIDGSMLQAQEMAEYFMQQSSASAGVQIGGKNTDVGRFVDRLSYFFKVSGKTIIEIDDQADVDAEMPFFVAVSEMSKDCQVGEQYKEYGIIKACKKFSGVTILRMN